VGPRRDTQVRPGLEPSNPPNPAAPGEGSRLQDLPAAPGGPMGFRNYSTINRQDLTRDCLRDLRMWPGWRPLMMLPCSGLYHRATTTTARARSTDAGRAIGSASAASTLRKRKANRHIRVITTTKVKLVDRLGQARFRAQQPWSTVSARPIGSRINPHYPY
jgi:hypothetical protein